MKASKRVSYQCDTWPILIITSYPIALERCGLREAGGKCTCFIPNPFSITGTVLMWHVSECVPGVFVYIYFVKTLEETHIA